MTASAGQPAVKQALPGVPLVVRLIGLGSVFGKTIRDSRRATIIVAGVIGLIIIAVAKGITLEFATPQSRQELRDLVATVPPILAGLAGKPVNVDTLGGYMQYKYGGFFPLVTGLWSILALSGTLAAEARRGSLEFVASSPVARRRIALEKLLGHVVVLVTAMAIVFVATALAGMFGTLPGDDISVAAAFGYAAWLALVALASGAVAFAIAPFLGRGAAAGLAGAIMFAGFLLNGYQGTIPSLTPVANLTWFSWTGNHIPLAGRFDWPSLLAVAVSAIILFAIGVEAFARRDLGSTIALPSIRVPRVLMGLRGPLGRAASERLPAGLAWGVGLGVFGLAVASIGRSFTDQIKQSPDLLRTMSSIFPGIDLTSTGGFLELLFVDFGLIFAGLAAATLVSGWASDEGSGRLELLLATPLTRIRWAVSSGIGVWVGIVVLTAVAAGGIAIGAASVGGDVATPTLGTLVLGLYAAALAGIGFAVGGLFGTGYAGPTVAVVTILTWLVGFLAPDLNLPDVFHQIALSAHMGKPMVGVWDAGGIAACVLLAVGGLALGALGTRRRDIGR